ncbi:MAG: AAA family ATPase, partial [Actinomycetia bacterium]|nr:AAA family ATPase [Actinomycetes bacterium]
MQESAAAPSSSRSTSFEILGPVTVTVDGIPVRLGGPRQVAVLARLLVDPGKIVSMDQLVDAVWDGDAPARPEVALRSYVSNLRRAIEPDRDRRAATSCIESRNPGYCLAIDSEAVDAHRFERLISAARSTPKTGACHLDLASEACELWRGEPFEGVTESDAIGAARSRLEELRLVATEIMVEAKLAVGHHEGVIAELERALSNNPLRERLTELMMLALYRAGRQSEALAVCSQLRKRLVDGQGIDPGRPVQELEHKILVHDASLEGPRSASVGNTKAPGSSNCTVIGRNEELGALSPIEDLVLEGRAASAVITGEPGSGKSVLARQLARDLEARGAHSTWGLCRALACNQGLWPWGQLLDGLGPEVATNGVLEGLQRLGVIAPGLLADQDSRVDLAATGPATMTEAASYFQPIVELLKRVSRQHPLAIIIEDAQWADEASIELLAYAGAALVDHPIAFVTTWRPTDLGQSPVRGVLRQLARLPNLIRVDLAGLDRFGVEELIVSINPEVRGMAPLIGEASAGNPMLVCELLAGLGSRPAKGAALSLDQHQLRPTPNLRDTMLDRIDRAHSAAVDVLSVGALLGTPFSAEILAGGVDWSNQVVEDVLDATVGAGLLVSGKGAEGQYWFRHPITAKVLIEEVSQPRRSRVHAALGHALLRDGRHPAEIAHQFAQADSSGSSVLAARFAIKSVSSAIDPVDIEAAAVIVSRGLDELERMEETAELEIRFCLFLCQWARIRGDEARFEALGRRLVDAAERVGESRHLVRALVVATGPDVAGPSWAIVDGGQPSAGTAELDDKVERASTRCSLEPLAPILWLRAHPEQDPSDTVGLGRLALRRERIRWAIEHGTMAQRATVLESVEAIDAPTSQDRLLTLRLEMISALENGDARGLDTIESELQSAIDDNPSLPWLDALTSKVALDLYRGRLDSARDLLTIGRRHCQHWGLVTRATLDQQALFVVAGGDDLSHRLESPEQAGPQPVQASRSTVSDRAALIVTREERVLTALLRCRANPVAAAALTSLGTRRPASLDEVASALEILLPLATTVITIGCGPVPLGPGSLYAARAALTVGDHGLARDLLDHSEDHARKVCSTPTLVRTLRCRAELG